MEDNDRTQKVELQGKGPISREQVKRLVEEGKALMEKDLRGGLAKLRQALKLDPAFPELENEIFLREDAIEKLDQLFDYIVVLLRGKKNYQAFQMLQGLPDNYIISDGQKIRGDLAAKIERVEELIRQIKSLPKAGGEQVQRLYEEALELIPDYPGLQDDYEAARKPDDRHQSYLDSIQESIESHNFSKADEMLHSFREAYPSDPNIARFEVVLRNKKKEELIKRNLKKKLAVTGATVGLLLALGLGYYGFETMQVRKAGQDWSRLNRLLEEKKFSEIQAAGRQINAELGRVKIFSQDRKAELLAQVKRVMSSEEVQQGAVGRVKAEGVGIYVPAGDLPQVKKTKELLAEAEKLGANRKHREAVAKYEEARDLLDGMEKDLGERFSGEIKAGILSERQAIVTDLIDEAREQNRKRDYATARARIDKAAALESEYELQDADLHDQIKSISGQINQENFQALVAVVDRQLRTGHDNEALAAYDRAQAFAKASGLATASANTLARLKEAIKVSRFRALLAEGDDSFAHSRWDEAITAYRAALQFHRDNRLKTDLPNYDRLQANLAAARRTVALENLRRADTEAGKLFAAGEWQQAKEAYTGLLALADKSGYPDDADFVKVRTAAQARAAELDDRLLIEAKKDYLRERQQALFRKVFNLGSGVAFLDPTVVFVTDDHGKLQFNLTARSYERRGNEGRYTYYEVNYAFNRKNGDWILLNKNMNSQVTGGR